MGGRRRAHGMAAAASSCLELASLGREGPGSVSTTSICSAFSYLDGDTEDIQVDEFERRVDALFDKRGSTREKALEALAVMLRVDYRASDCMAHSETLTSRCLAALKRGSASPVESSLAAQLLGLHVLTLGQPDERLFQVLRPELERSVSGAAGGGPAVQVAAADTLALAAFVLAEDEGGTRAAMDRLRALWAKGDVKVRAAAVRGWSFLLTSLDGRLRDGDAAAILVALSGLMTSERDLDLRTAAGEAAAVLQDCCGSELQALVEEAGSEGALAGWCGVGDAEVRSADPVVAQEDGSDCEQVDVKEAVCRQGERSGGGRHNTAGGGGDGGRRSGSGDGGGQLGDLVERMQELATNKGDVLRRNRRERALQRATFRGLLAALSGEAVPYCRIKLRHGDSLHVEGVAPHHRLAFLRRFLAGGFQAHLQLNPLLHDVFGFRPRAEPRERLTALEKRLSRSCHSAEARARSANRRWSRDAKAASRLLEFGC